MPRHGVQILACLLTAAHCAFCQDAQTLAKKVTARYKGLAGYQVQGTFEVAGGQSSEAGALAWTVSKFEIAGGKEAKQRVDYKGPSLALTVISNGSTFWTYLPAQKMYTQVDAVADTSDDDDAGETAAAEAPKNDNIAMSVYALAVTRFATFDRFAKGTQIAGEQDIKTAEGKVHCWILKTTFPDRIEKDWVAQESFLVFRSEAQVKSKDLTTKLVISIRRFDPEPPPADQFTFTPGKKDRRVDELSIPGVSPIFVGKPATDFTLQSVNGEQVRLADFRGKIVVLDFWATWCPPCRQELPVINKLSAQLRDKDVVFFGINDEGAGTVKGFNKNNKYTFTTLEDPGRKVSRIYGARAIPNVFIIGKDGVIVKHFVGSRDESVLMAGIETAKSR